MSLLPPTIRNLLARKAAPAPLCTPDNVDALLGRIISHENNTPGTMGAQWISHELERAGDESPDQIARNGQGE